MLLSQSLVHVLGVPLCNIDEPGDDLLEKLTLMWQRAITATEDTIAVILLLL